MAISHACPRCGTSLTRVRAPLDPIYGLAIVICPGCRAASVRRRPPAAAAWRKFCLAFAAARAAAFACLAAAVICGGTAGLAAGQYSQLHDAGMSPRDLVNHWTGADPIPDAVEAWRVEQGPLLLQVAFAWCLLCGVVLGAILPHVRSRMAIWAGAISAVVTLIWLPECITFVDRSSRYDQITFQTEPESQITLIALIAGGLMLLAMPLGMRIRARMNARPARRIARLRNRLRARRSHA